eukprot:Gb_33057 [translate_table: standard]
MDPKQGKQLDPPSIHPPTLPFHKLLSFADVYDLALIFVGTVGAVGNGAALPLYIVTFGYFMNGFGQNIDDKQAMADAISKYTVYIVYVGILIFAASWAEISCWMHTGERQTTKMRYEYLQSILKQEVGLFDADTRTGALVDSLSTDFVFIQDALGEKMGSFIRYLTAVIVGFAFAGSYVWRVALVTLAIGPPIVLCGALYGHTLARLTSKSQKALGDAGTHAGEVFAQIRAVYSYVGESKALRSYSQKLEIAVKLGYKEGLVKGVGMGAIRGLLVFGAWALVTWYAGVLVRNGSAGVGQSLTAIFCVVTASIYSGYAFSSLASFAKGKAAYSKIMEMINRKPALNQNLIDGLTLEQVIQGNIEFKNVGFSYPSRPDVIIFQNFCLNIHAGKAVAIVGSSGSGKSTIISLVERFYDPTEGQILLDEHDIKSLNIKWLREQIGLVSQEPVLFSTTILENILYGKVEGADIEEVIAAATAANAHDFITDLPEGYQTKVGERGVQLSGGQKQRVAIARAILRNPKILLLDEATSALDANSENIVQTALNKLMVGSGRTTVVVAHRLSTIRKVDTIAVLSQGNIVEMGSHEELIAKGEQGAYFSLVKLQELANSCNAIETTSEHTIPKSSRWARRSDSGAPQLSPKTLTSDPPDQTPDLKRALIGKTESSSKPSKASLWRLLRLSAPEWPCAAIGSVGSILLGCATPTYGVVLAHCISTFYSEDHIVMKQKIRLYTLLYIGVGAIYFVGNILQQFFFAILGENLTKRVREMMFTAILRNEVSWFDKDENSSIRISSRLASDATNVKTVVGDRLFLLVQNLTVFVASFAVCFRAQWQMTLVLLATFPLLITATIVQRLSMKGFGGDQAKAHSEATMVAGEAVSNMRTVAAFNGEERVLSVFKEFLNKPMKRSFRTGQIAGFIYGISHFAMYCSYGLALWYGSRLVKNGTTDFANVMVVYVILITTSYSVGDTLSMTSDIAKGQETLNSVFGIIDRQTLMDADDPQALKVESLKGEIELRKVHFCYPSRPEVSVLKDVDLKLEAGNSLAVVGASGSGKSSIIALIQRFYDPVFGAVLIDGLDLRTVDIRAVRKQIALVQQEPALFATSIRENILYGKESASEEEMVNAAKIANAHSFISGLPSGYDTTVGERGVEMSGGQKQRLAIARAVLKNPCVLLLDEATSGLDAESESAVQEALERVMEGRTCIVVAHRLSSIRNVSVIAVLNDGRIVEEGSHEELLSRTDSEYRRLQNINAET